MRSSCIIYIYRKVLGQFAVVKEWKRRIRRRSPVELRDATKMTRECCIAIDGSNSRRGSARASTGIRVITNKSSREVVRTRARPITLPVVAYILLVIFAEWLLYLLLHISIHLAYQVYVCIFR